MVERLVKIGLGVGLLWYGILRGAKGLVVRIKDYSFYGVNLDNMTVSLQFNLLIKNPLLVGLTLKGVSGDVYMQGEKVGFVNMSYDYYLGGGKTHIIPVIVNLDISGVGAAALRNIQSGDISTLSLAFNGKLCVGKYYVPVPLQFETDYKKMTA